MRSTCVLLAFAVVLALPFTAQAQPESDSTRTAARQLGEEGVALYQKADYAAALDRFVRARALLDVPTLGLFEARCLDKLGRMIEANERYLAVTRLELADTALEVHRTAQRDAAKEREELQSRIPRLEIVVTGVPKATVTLDGRRVPDALVGVPQPVDPGTHRIVGVAGGQTVERSLELARGARQRVELAFGPAPTVVAPPEASAGRATPVASAPSPAEGDTAGQGQRTAAYVALGVGGAGIVVGSIAGVLALGKKSDLDSGCVDRQCGPQFHEDVDGYDSLRLISTIGFGVGLLGGAAGGVLLLTAPSEPGVTASVSLTGAQVGGRF